MGNYILVTGGSRGLGLTIVKRLLSAGYNVIAASRKKTDEINLLQQQNENLSWECIDLLSVAEIKNFCRQIDCKYGRLYGLVNNAALGYDGVLSTMHETQISDLIKVNIEAPILLSKYLTRGMLINQCGRIVNISSIIANTGYSGLSVYAASKSAAIGFSKSLARELGRANITVNTICPGYMETDMTAGLAGEKLESIKRRSALRTLAKTDDVAAFVEYLLSNKSSRITGAVFTVDAGNTA